MNRIAIEMQIDRPEGEGNVIVRFDSGTQRVEIPNPTLLYPAEVRLVSRVADLLKQAKEEGTIK